MTVTVETIVTGAMRNLNLLAAGQDADAAEAAEILTSLNDMMLAMPAKGIHTGWTTLTLTDNFPLEDRHIEGVKWVLAEKIAPTHGVKLSVEQLWLARDGRIALESDYKVHEDLRVDAGLQYMPSQRRWWR